MHYKPPHSVIRKIKFRDIDSHSRDWKGLKRRLDESELRLVEKMLPLALAYLINSIDIRFIAKMKKSKARRLAGYFGRAS